MGITFPSPFILQIDNTTAEAFINASTNRSKLKHIDVRQWWCQMLRDKSVLKPQHIDSPFNLADLFTKILDRPVFERLRDRIMVPFEKPQDPRSNTEPASDED